MKYDRLTRRMFLQGAGGVLMHIPFLTSLLPRDAWAQVLPVKKRFISVLMNYDYGHNAAWFPNGEANLTNLPLPARSLAVGSGHHAVHYQALRDFAPTAGAELSRILGASLSPYLESVNILRSLGTIRHVGHSNANSLGGVESSNVVPEIPTIDTVLANSRKFNPNGVPHLFFGEGGHTGCWSWTSGPRQAVRSARSSAELRHIYGMTFKHGAFPQNGTTSAAHPRRDVLSRVLEDYTRIRQHPAISSSDRASLDVAMDSMSQAIKGLNYLSTPQCQYSSVDPSVNTVTARSLTHQVASSSEVGQALANIISAMIVCDAARTLTFGAPFLGGLHDGAEFTHHGTSHNPFLEEAGKINWIRLAERKRKTFENFIRPLVQNLSSAIEPENGKSCLYNSLIFVSHESGQMHGRASHPALLIGQAGGAIRGGNYIDYANRAQGPQTGCDGYNAIPGDARFSNNWYGVPYNRLMVTILQAMGLSPADYENHGLNRPLEGRMDIGAQNSGLRNLGGYGYALGELDVGRFAKELAKYDFRFYKDPLPHLLL